METELQKIERVFPKDFYPETNLLGKVMSLWQCYQAELNKNKSLAAPPLAGSGGDCEVDGQEYYVSIS